ncbi:hypothetical protein GCM10009527_078290 [Actinomadura nitritigenes]|jgi:hypothetical protein|uniref:Uncharacterized protein n=1 Tax=Actinomadura nitritigenes TaxID=134602 RepID=A0ABS3QU71_9ACTN|nr:hypothetical protein [Actinomadura nitritigenes]MBO2437476.1 hypothetical protein [Actinomadura nitritigenes]
MAEDDFRRWERELDPGPPEKEASGGRGLVVAAAVTAAGCALLIVVGDARLGAVGLVVSSVILLLWRIGF